MAKKPVKGTGFRLTLGDLHKTEDRVLNYLDKIHDRFLPVEDVQNLIRSDIDAARGNVVAHLLDRAVVLLERQNTTDAAVSTFEKNSCRVWDEIRSVLNRHKHESSGAIRELKEILPKQMQGMQDSIRAYTEIAGQGVLTRLDQKILDVLDRQNTTDFSVQDLREVLLKQVKDESLEIVKGYRALTHFSWEKLSETEDRIIQAQNATTKLTMLVSLVQCILTLAVVGAVLWFR